MLVNVQQSRLQQGKKEAKFSQQKNLINSKKYQLKYGYYSVPDLEQLNWMTQQQLRNIDSLIIGNEFAEIRYLQTVDLVGQDLTRVFNFKYKKVQIYPSKYFLEFINKPRPGEKLNQKALIVIKNFLKENQKYEEIQNSIWNQSYFQGLKYIGFSEQLNEIYFESF